MPGYVYRGDQPHVEEPEQGNSPQCGTEAGCSRHRRRGEPVDKACRRAAAAASKARRDAKREAAL